MGTISLVPDGVNGSVSMSADGVTGTVTNPFLDGVSLGLGPFVPGFFDQALVNLSESGITGVASVSSWTNTGTGGSDFDLNVPVGTGANVKPHPSDSMVLFGASGDYASTPDSAAASITGDIDIRCEARLDDWTPAAASTLVAKRVSSGNQRSYYLFVETDGSLIVKISSDGGTTAATYISSANPTVSNGSTIWIRFTLDVDNGAGDSDGTFFTSPDGVVWTQLGTVRNSGSTETIFDGTAPVEIGSHHAGTAGNVDGSIFQAQIYNGIQGSGGTLAVSFNAADYVNRSSDTAFPSTATSEIWTLNGNSYIQNTGHKVSHSIGSAGLESTAGQTIASPGTVFVVAKYSDPNPSVFETLFASRSLNTAVWTIATDQFAGDKWFLNQSVAGVVVQSSSYDTASHVFTGQFNGDSTSKLTVSGVDSDTGDAGSHSWDYASLFIGRGGTQSMQGYIATLIVFDYALSESEITDMQNYLAAAYRTSV